MVDVICIVREVSKKIDGILTKDASKGRIVIEKTDEEGVVSFTIEEDGKDDHGPFKFNAYEILEAVEKASDYKRRPRYQAYDRE